MADEGAAGGTGAGAARLALPLGLTRLFPWLPEALAPMRVVALENPFAAADAAAGWGRKLSWRWARRLAALRGLPCWTLEDGFFRSVGLGKRGAPAWSIVLDRTGIYFDGRAASDVEALIAAPPDPAMLARGARLRDLIVRSRLSKYNHVPDRPLALAAPAGARRIVVLDQVAGDQSLPGAGADEAAFAAMARAAAEARGAGAAVFLKTHPDVEAGLARGMLGAVDLPRVPAGAHPHALLDEVDEVWTASSQLGFEALIRGRAARCFAAPFYAGWGLTQDSPATPEAAAILARRPRRDIALDALIDAAVGRYPLYFDVARRRPVDAEEGLERLAAARDASQA